MTYEEFCAGIGEYSALWNKGLKKQANKALAAFVEDFQKTVPQDNADEILYRFCREYFDESKLPELKQLGCSRLPYSLMGLVHEYLKRECLADKMPQLRWAYQLGGRYFNPFDPNSEQDTYDIMKRAYEHPDCDRRTILDYFCTQIENLDFGAHHFPEGCCIAREAYEENVKTAERILSEHALPPECSESLEYYKTLYRVYFEWVDGGRKGDFDELIKAAGIEFTAPKAFYYK